MTQTKKSTGAFIKDAMNGEFLEKGIDEIHTVRLSKQVELDGEIKNLYATMQVGASSYKKVLALFNPKRVVFQIWENPSQENIEKYGEKARGRYVDFDDEQLRLASGNRS